MRQCIGGDGSDTTAAVLSHLAANKQLQLANLYLIGEADDPQAIWMTDWESPLIWNPWGTFRTAAVKRGPITTKIGLDVEPLSVTWAPGNRTYTQFTTTNSPLGLAAMGFYDNWRVRVWRCFMPTPGDANTLGAAAIFGGRIASTEITAGRIVWSVDSYMSVLSQKLPANVIEATNTLAGYTATQTVDSETELATFKIFTGSTPNVLLADCLTPSAGKIYGDHKFDEGYLVFLSGAGATLAGMWAKIGHQTGVQDGNGNHHNQFQLYGELPYAPTPNVDTFYVSATAPINLADTGYLGFPYVPSPETAV